MTQTLEADLVVTNIGRLVTCAPGIGEGSLGVIERGALAATEGTVVWVGPEAELRERVPMATAAIDVDAGGRAVLPGLVDPHTHLVFAGDRSAEFAARMRGDRYAAWGVRTTVAATGAASDEELRTLALARLDTFLLHGVTTVEAKTGYGRSVDDELRSLEVIASLKHTVRVVPTFLGAHVPPHDGSADDHIEAVCEQMPAAASRARFADVWCDEGAFSVEQARRVLQAARAAGLGLKVHAEQLARTGGAALASEMGAVSAEHLEHADEADARALAAAGTVAVLMPGASLMTGARPAPARMLIDAGVRVALSTDLNPGSSYSENLQLQVALGCTTLGLTPEEALLGVTRHAAAALGLEGTVGSLQPGARCDLLILDASSEIDLAYHYGVNLAGRVLAGAPA